MRQCFITQGITLFVKLIEPARFIVLALFIVIATEQAVVELIVITDNQAGVGVMAHIVVLHLVVFEQITDYTEQECGVGTRAYWRIQIGDGGTTVKTRVDYHHGGVVFSLRFDYPFKAYRMCLSGITAHNKHYVGIFNIDPVVGHRTTSKRWCKSSNGGAMT